MMTQIKFCLDYCEASGRLCVIDTKRVREFENDIFDFFDISHSCLSSLSPPEFYRYVSETPHITIFPPIITPDILPYFLANTRHPINGYRIFNGVSTKLDITRDNNETVIVHYNSGSGDSAAWFLKSFSPKPILFSELKRRASALGESYLGVHIRNTDYKSDVSGFLAENDSVLREAITVFLATDNPHTLLTIRAIYGEKINHSLISRTIYLENLNIEFRGNLPPLWLTHSAT